MHVQAHTLVLVVQAHTHMPPPPPHTHTPIRTRLHIRHHHGTLTSVRHGRVMSKWDLWTLGHRPALSPVPRMRSPGGGQMGHCSALRWGRGGPGGRAGQCKGLYGSKKRNIP